MDGADEERLLRALAIIERLEWSDSVTFNENMHSAPSYTTIKDLCPYCGGSENAREGMPEEKWGHREDCEIRKVLGRPVHAVQNVAYAERIRRKRAHDEMMRTQREGPWKEFHEGKFKEEMGK